MKIKLPKKPVTPYQPLMSDEEDEKYRREREIAAQRRATALRAKEWSDKNGSRLWSGSDEWWARERAYGEAQREKKRQLSSLAPTLGGQQKQLRRELSGSLVKLPDPLVTQFGIKQYDKQQKHEKEKNDYIQSVYDSAGMRESERVAGDDSPYLPKAYSNDQRRAAIGNKKVELDKDYQYLLDVQKTRSMRRAVSEDNPYKDLSSDEILERMEAYRREKRLLDEERERLDADTARVQEEIDREDYEKGGSDYVDSVLRAANIIEPERLPGDDNPQLSKGASYTEKKAALEAEKKRLESGQGEADADYQYLLDAHRARSMHQEAAEDNPYRNLSLAELSARLEAAREERTLLSGERERQGAHNIRMLDYALRKLKAEKPAEADIDPRDYIWMPEAKDITDDEVARGKADFESSYNDYARKAGSGFLWPGFLDEHMSKEEQRAFYAMWDHWAERGDEETLLEVGKRVYTMLSGRMQEKLLSEGEQKMAEGGADGAAATVITGLLRTGLALEAPVAYAGDMLNNTAYNAAHGTDYAVPKLTTGTNAMVAKNRSTEALLSQVPEELRPAAELGLSIADNAMNTLIFRQWSPAVMALQAGTDTAHDVAERGGTGSQQWALGGAAAASEFFFERVSFKGLTNLATDRSLTKSFAKNLLSQSAIEAKEEMATEAANIAADLVIMRDKSDVAQYCMEYMAQHPDAEAAEIALNTAFQVIGRIGEAGIGGFVSGGVMGSGAQIYGNVRNGLTAFYTAAGARNAESAVDSAYRTIAGQGLWSDESRKRSAEAAHLARTQGEVSSRAAQKVYGARDTEGNFFMLPVFQDGKVINTTNEYDPAKAQLVERENIGRYRREIDGVFDGSLPRGKEITLGDTPELYLRYGAHAIPMRMSRNTAMKIAYPEGYPADYPMGKHNLGISALKNLPGQIADPMAILRSQSQKNSLVILTQWEDSKGNPVIVPIHLDKNGALSIQNEIPSAYGKKDLQPLLGEKNENVLYTKNNESVDQLLSTRLQLPSAMADDTLYIHSITGGEGKVNNFQYPPVFDSTGKELYRVTPEMVVENGELAQKMSKENALIEGLPESATEEDIFEGLRRMNPDADEEALRNRAAYLDASRKLAGGVELSKLNSQKSLALAAAIEKSTGLAVRFGDVTESGAVVKGEGLYDRGTGTIWINPRLATKEDVVRAVAVHELVHSLETMPEYDALQRSLFDWAFRGDEGKLSEAVRKKTERYRGAGETLNEEQAKKELTSELAARYFGTEAGVNTFVLKNPGLAGRVYAAVKRAADQLRGFVTAEKGHRVETLQELRRVQQMERHFEKALRQFRQSKKGGGEGVQYKLGEYTQQEKKNWENSKNIVLYENTQQLKQFVQNALNGKELNKKMYFGKTNEKISQYVFEKTGVDISGYNCVLRASEVRKIIKDHGNEKVEMSRGQRAIQEQDFFDIPYILEYPDSVSLDSNLFEGKPVLIFQKVLNGKTTIVAYISNKHLDLTVQTMYSGQNKRSLATTPSGENSFSQTSETLSGTASSAFNVPQKGEENKSGGTQNSGNGVSHDMDTQPGIQWDAKRFTEEYFTGQKEALDNIAKLGEVERKANHYLRRAKGRAVSELAERFQLKPHQREVLREQVDEIAGEILETGKVSDAMEDEIVQFVSGRRAGDGGEVGRVLLELAGRVNRMRANYYDEWRQRSDYLSGDRLSPEDSKRYQQENKEIEEMKRTYNAAVKDSMLTEKEMDLAQRIRSGKETEDKIEPWMDREGVLRIARAGAALDQLKKPFEEFRRRQAEAREKALEPLIEHSDDWDDKFSGKLYSTETQERNIIDIAGKEDGERIIRAIFDPIHKNEAESVRFRNRIRERVRKLELTPEESYWVQMYGEKQAGLSDVPGAMRDKVVKATAEFRAIYDELLDMANRVLVNNGFAPVPKRKDYFPHFIRQSDPVANALSAMGISIESSMLPTDIAGLTYTFKPGKKYFGNFNRRYGNQTTFDAVEGLDRYLDGIADVIFHTDDIQNLRAFDRLLRRKYSEGNIREQIQKVEDSAELSAEEKRQKIEELLYGKDDKKGKLTQMFRLSNYVQNLTEYTNLLAGKKAFADRNMEQQWGRITYDIAAAVERNVAANMVAVNPGSWLTNFIPLTQAASAIKNKNLLRGMWETVHSIWADDGFRNRSTFLTNRAGTDRLRKGMQERASDIAGKPMEWIDRFTSQSIVRAKYYDLLERGYDAETALARADRFAASVIGDRSKGAMPTWFYSKNPGSKALTMFQLEVNNQYRYLFKDLPRDIKADHEKWLGALIWGWIKYFFGAYLFNDVYEAVVGRRPAFDLFGTVNDVIGKFTGYKASNVVDIGGKLISGQGFQPLTQTEKKEGGELFFSTAKEIGGNLPFVGGFLDGGRIPISSAMPDFERLFTMDGDTASNKKFETWLREGVKPVMYLLPTFGMGQVAKSAEGLATVNAGGGFGLDKEGRKQLQFPVEQTAGNYIKAGLFGKYALPGAQEYVDSGFQTLSAEKTSAALQLRETGVPLSKFLEIDKELSDEEKYKDDIGKDGFKIEKSGSIKKRKYIDSLGFDTKQRKILYDAMGVAKEVAQAPHIAVAGLSSAAQEDATIANMQGRVGYKKFAEVYQGWTAIADRAEKEKWEDGEENKKKRQYLYDDQGLTSEQKALIDNLLINDEKEVSYESEGAFRLSQRGKTDFAKGEALAAVSGLDLNLYADYLEGIKGKRKNAEKYAVIDSLPLKPNQRELLKALVSTSKASKSTVRYYIEMAPITRAQKDEFLELFLG